MKTIIGLTCVLLASLGTLIPNLTFGQDKVEVKTVVERLNNPCGIAIQPETGHVFVSDSGALRVVRIVDGKAEPVITGFPKDNYGKGPIYDIGPLGLVFIDKNTLVVGGGGKPDGEEMLRVYKIPAAGAAPIDATQMHGDPKTLPANGEVVGEGNFYGLAKGSQGIFVTCNGDDGKGWISLAKINEGKVSNFERKIATKKATKVDAPVAITISPEGFLAVGQMGEITLAGDSLLTFYDEDGKKLENFKTDLFDITGLAYGPKRGRLFATDFRWLDTEQGGLYKIIAIKDNYEKCKPQKIVSLKKPTALAFHPNGDLYITLAGNPVEGTGKPNGKLVMIKGLDAEPKK